MVNLINFKLQKKKKKNLSKVKLLELVLINKDLTKKIPRLHLLFEFLFPNSYKNFL